MSFEFKAARDAKKITENLKVLADKVVTINGCKIIFPVRYVQAKLAQLDYHVTYYGCFCMLDMEEKYYSVHNGLVRMTSIPDDISTIEINGEPYYRLTFEAGSTVFEQTTVLKDSDLVSDVYTEFVNKGSVPFFMDYDDVLRLFDTDKEYGGVSLSTTYEAIEIPLSIIARNPNDLTQYYREILNEVDPKVVKPVYVAANSVTYSASSTVTKLTGSYFTEGLVSAINNPTKQTDALDYVLRY